MAAFRPRGWAVRRAGASWEARSRRPGPWAPGGGAGGRGNGVSLTGVGAHRAPASSLSVSSVWGLDEFSAEEGGAGRRVLRAWQQHKIVSSCSVGPVGSLTVHW